MFHPIFASILICTTLTACQHNTLPHASITPIASHDSQRQYDAQTLIVYYDAQIGKQPLLDALPTLGATVLYDYRHFNSVAIQVTQGQNIEQMATRLQQVRGVLQVNRNEIMSLH